MKIIIKRRKDWGLPLWVGCDQLCLAPSQMAGWSSISLEGIYQYLKFFVCGESCQVKLGFETTSFCLVWSVVSTLIRVQDSLIINILGKSYLIFQLFLHGDRYQGKVASVTNTFGWMWPDAPLLSSQILEFFLLS